MIKQTEIVPTLWAKRVLPHLLCGLFDQAFRLPLVFSLHHFLDVVEDLGVFVVAHVLAAALVHRLRAAVLHARPRRRTRGRGGRGGRESHLPRLRGDGQALRLVGHRSGDLLARAHSLHLRFRLLEEDAGRQR